MSLWLLLVAMSGQGSNQGGSRKELFTTIPLIARAIPRLLAGEAVQCTAKSKSEELLPRAKIDCLS
jgi:hypothetical protein